jgi:hypothetical protein
MKKIIFYIFTTITFTNCLEVETIDYKLPFEQKTVALGFMDSVNGVRVYVGKNVPVLSNDSTSVIKDVKVELWSDETMLEKLNYLDKNVFVSTKNTKINPSKSYYFKATTPLSMDTLISEKVILPSTIPIENVRFQYKNVEKTTVDLFIQITDPVGFNAYAFNIQRFKKDTLFGTTITDNPFFIPSNGYLYSDREFEGTKHTFILENINVEEYQDQRFIELDKIRVTIFSLSKPTYEAFLSLRTLEPSVGDPFFEPTIILNQIKNGLGVFGTYSSFSFDLKIR